MSDGSSFFLVTLFLGAQLALCLALALALTYHERVYRQANLRDWRASFVALAVYAAFSLVVYFLPRAPEGETLRFVARAGSLVAAGLHAGWLVIGAYRWQYRRALEPRVARGLLAGLALVSLGIALWGRTGTPMHGAMLRSLVTTLLVPLAYLLVAAWALTSQRGRIRHARVMIAGALAALAVAKLATFVAVVSGSTVPWLIALLHRSSTIELGAMLLLFVGWLFELFDAERRRADAATDALATRDMTDAATGLPNRASLVAWVARELQRGEPLVLVALGTARARALRDVLGDAAHASLFARIAGNLRRAAPAGSFVARLDEDRLGIAAATNARQADELAHALARAAGAERGEDANWVVAAGYAASPGDASDAESLIAAASAAQTAAEARERGAVERFHPGHARQLKRIVAAPHELRRALQERELELYFQEIRALGASGASYHEALLRWRHPRDGVLAPAAFFDLVAAAGAEADVDRYVIEAAIAAAGARGMRIAVNLFATTLQRPELAGWIQASLEAHGVAPAAIEIEVTEAAVIADLGIANEMLGAIRRLGLRLAIDDFGVGHSSLARLRDLPLHKLKIDRSFVASLGRGDRDEAIVRSIIDLGRHLGLEIVAEGVETEAQLERLSALGVDYAQGYLLGVPEPLAALDRQARASSA